MKNNVPEIQAEFELKQFITDWSQLKISTKRFKTVMANYPEASYRLRTYIKHCEEIRSWHCQQRKLEVLYLTGKSGSGKTTLAKYFSEKLFGYDCFISGSGEDILDGYDMEECIILDDYRADVFKFAEFLKFIDNHTNSTVKSRFHNKDISNCKLIILTSIIHPEDLYFKDKDEKAEDKEQFFRRLKHHYFEIKNNNIENYTLNLIDNSWRYDGMLDFTIEDVYKELGINIEEKDNSIFDQFLNKQAEKPIKKIEYEIPPELEF